MHTRCRISADKHQKTFGLSPLDPVAAKKGKGRDGKGVGREGRERKRTIER